MSIPDDWSYETEVVWNWSWRWPFRTKTETKTPHAWVLEGTSQIQCMCPNCEYGRGYNEAISGVFDTLKYLKCDKCDTEFFGPSLSP